MLSRSFTFFLFLLAVYIELAPAPSITPPGKYWRLNDGDIQKLKAKCKRIDGNCKSQPKDAVKARQSLKKSIIQKTKRKESDVEEAFKKTHLAKKALYKLYGLENIEPADTGVWSRNIMLNSEQADFLINYYASGGKTRNITMPAGMPPMPKGNGAARGKRSVGLRYDAFPNKKWSNPIPVLIDPDYPSDVSSEIRRALSDISASSCIKFDYLKATPDDSNIDYMVIVSFDISGGLGCGAVAQIGKQRGVTLVSIPAPKAPFCVDPIYGVALHEIMHALGFHHEHQRFDRDQYITMMYAESDPLYMDNLARLPTDTYSYYGTRYDYLSILHYSLKFGWFKLVPGMGGEQYQDRIGNLKELSKIDIEGLNNAYCQSADCQDKYPDWCPTGDSLYKFCQWENYPIEQYCAKTCGKC